MSFFDFLRRRANGDQAKMELPPIEIAVKESVAHLNKCQGKITSKQYEAEAINLASYIYLRGNKGIDFTLDYIPKGVMGSIPSGDYSVADKVFPLMAKYSGGVYSQSQADFGREKGYKLNVSLDPHHADFLRGYFHTVHKIVVSNQRTDKTEATTLKEEKAIDLGLTSGILWGTCNIGATSESDFGSMFAWGEKSTKDVYSWDTYMLCHGSYNSIFKYTSNDNKISLDEQDDVASQILGKGWRIPTRAEMEELVNECHWSWVSENGHYGWRVKGKNGNSIFLPAAGSASSYRVAGTNELGRYWTSSRDSDNYSAYNLRFKSGNETIEVVADTRFYGRSVRAVYGKQSNNSNVQHESVKEYNLQGTPCEVMIRQLLGTMRNTSVYAGLDQSIKMLPNGGIRIHQEEDGRLFNDFDFLGRNGWIRYVRIYGRILDKHYETIGNSMEIFGLKVDNITYNGQYVECVINQSQFGL